MTNSTPQMTRAAATTQEVSVRTLASDASSLEHGAQTPTPVQLTASRAPAVEEVETVPTQHGWVRLLIVLLVLAALGYLAYQYVYPALVGPAVIGF